MAGDGGFQVAAHPLPIGAAGGRGE